MLHSHEGNYGVLGCIRKTIASRSAPCRNSDAQVTLSFLAFTGFTTGKQYNTSHCWMGYMVFIGNKSILPLCPKLFITCCKCTLARG